MIDPTLDDDSNVVWRDAILLALAGFVMVALLLLPHVNPPGRQADGASDPPGNVNVLVRWPDGWRTDVDLWAQVPGDVAVGYSNKGGLVANLLRDDLGGHGDPLGMNFENVYTRGVVPGEYTVNLHLFRNLQGTYPVPVEVAVECRKDSTSTTAYVVSRAVELHREGEEVTAIRFALDEHCGLKPGSVHALFRPLRSVGK